MATPRACVLQGPGDELAVKDLLDEAYEKDASNGGYVSPRRLVILVLLNDRQILQTSIYYERTPQAQSPTSGGSHGRYVCYGGRIKTHEILQAEADGEYDVYIDGTMERRHGKPKGDIFISGERSVAPPRIN
ncbi:MAG: hypothetical protein Q9194_004889 [Teloschistes cf. exilis]